MGRRLACLVAACAWLLLAAPEAFGFGFERRWGSQGREDGEFQEPKGIAVDRHGFVYVAESEGARVQKFTRDGAFVAGWRGAGIDGGQLVDPRGIAVDDRGNVYVADGEDEAVKQFTDGGVFVRSWRSGEGMEGSLFDARGIAVDSAGFVYVATNGQFPRIQKFTADGTFVAMWGYQGTPQSAFGEVSGVAGDSQDNVYATGTDSPRTGIRVFKFSSTGSPITSWRRTDALGNEDFSGLSGVAIAPDDSVYTVETGLSRVRQFTPTGEFIREFGGRVDGDYAEGRFYYPEFLAVDAGGRIYVTDTIGDTVSVFGSVGTTTPIPDPVVNRSISVAHVTGDVSTRCGNDRRFTVLPDAMRIPVGCEVDARRGQVRLTSAAGPNPQAQAGRPAPVQTAAFDGGIFQVLQRRSAGGLTELELSEALACRRNSSGARSRRLWGRGSGRFRTRGRFSTATVRGTTWLTKDSCNATTTVVREGTVVVRDLSKRQNVRVRAGRRYTARSRTRR
jgi:DNA-binding beta-propeller fold protein YncE